MATELLHERGRGQEIVGTRITIYNLLPHFLDPTSTEAYICQVYDLTPEQVAAARAYVLNNPEAVFAEHRRIEGRMAAGNPREVTEQAKKTHEAFVSFKEWLIEREKTASAQCSAERKLEARQGNSSPFPTFREWLAERGSRPVAGS